jgi:broad specificity phosphatase PhoE
MKKIILVRHGEALWNKTGELMWCRIWSQLSEKWKEQALLVAEFLNKNYNIDAFYSSPVNRAIETAEIIRNKNGLEYIINDDIREIDFWDMTWKKISEIPKEIDLKYMKDSFNHRHVGWENMCDLFDRVKKFLNEEIYISDSKEILLVSHDNIIKAFVWVFTGITKEVISLKIGNCSIVEYEINENNAKCLNFSLNYYLG